MQDQPSNATLARQLTGKAANLLADELVRAQEAVAAAHLRLAAAIKVGGTA